MSPEPDYSNSYILHSKIDEAAIITKNFVKSANLA